MVGDAIMKLLDAWHLHQMKKWEATGQVNKLFNLYDKRHDMYLRRLEKNVEFWSKHEYDPAWIGKFKHVRADTVLLAVTLATSRIFRKKEPVTDESHGRAMGRGGD